MLQEKHQRAIECYQRSIPDRDDQVLAIQYEDLALQVWKSAGSCHVPRTNDPHKDNIDMITEENIILEPSGNTFSSGYVSDLFSLTVSCLKVY